jgi:glycolate oxidase FAD binding subunit
MKAALITGEEIKFGGKVVKNVAGYDMCKLFTGSLGTLGVITEVTARVGPIPDTAATLVVFGSFDEVAQYARGLSQSPLLPAAVALMNFQNSGGKPWQVAVWCDGFEETVARHVRDAQTLARQLALDATILRRSAHDPLWDRVRDFPLESERCVYRAIIPSSTMAKFVEGVNQIAERAPAVMADMATGTVWLSWPASESKVAFCQQLVSLATAHRGHAVLFSAPRQSKEGFDVWGQPPAALPLMRGIKQQFDPHGLLNPGRFVGGI